MARDLTDLARAWQLVAFFLGEAPEPAGPVDFDVLGALAERHRVDAALAEPRLTRLSPERRVPDALWRRWRNAHAAALARAALRAGADLEAFEALADIPAVVLKGWAAAELLYPSPGARSFGDLDLLVPAPELDEALRRLEPLGYRRPHQGHPTLDAPSFHERQLVGPELELDIHQGFNQPARFRIDYRAVLDRSLPWPAAAPNARLLAPEDAVVYQTIHAGCGELAPQCAPAVGLLDLRQMLGPRASFWGPAGGPRLRLEDLAPRALAWGAERMLYAVLAWGARLFPTLAPAAAAAAEALSPLTRSLLDRAVVDRASPPRLSDPLRPEVLARKALLLRPAARLALLAERLPQLARE